MENKVALIIGGGIAGCAAAHQLELLGGLDVTIIEASGHIGAGNRTFYKGGHPYTFGPRHFLTRWENVYNYLNEIVPLRLCEEHEFITYIENDQNFYSFPINEDDIPRMPDCERIQSELEQRPKDFNPRNFEEYWRGAVGESLYNKFINTYSKKMWDIESNSEIDTFSWSPKGVALKKGSRAAWDDAISGYPYSEDGYDYYLDYSTKSARILLNSRVESFDLEKSRCKVDGQEIKYDVLISTISVDELFGFELGELPYMGRNLETIILPVEFAMPKDVYFTYYAGEERYTRIVEYKKFTRHKSESTLLGIEYPSKNGKFYPVPLLKNFQLAEKYYEQLPSNVFSMGRNGCYRYGCDIDDCIMQAMKLAESIKVGDRDHAVPGRDKRNPFAL